MRTPWPSGKRVPTDDDLAHLEAECARLWDEWDVASLAAEALAVRWNAARDARDRAFERLRNAGYEIVRTG